VVEANIP